MVMCHVHRMEEVDGLGCAKALMILKGSNYQVRYDKNGLPCFKLRKV